MKDEFFEKVLNVVENRPFLTTVTRDGQMSQTIAQIREGRRGELAVVLQGGIGPLFGSDDAETTVTLPNSRYSEPFGMIPVKQGFADAAGERTVPLYPGESLPFNHFDDETTRIINGENIALVEPVRAKTLTLWYDNIGAESWMTNVHKEEITILHGDSSAAEIPPHGASDFFIAFRRPETDQPPIEWDIGDTHQGAIIRTDQENPFVKISIAPSRDRDIYWGEYVARMWVEHEEFEIKDVGFHVWRVDDTAMDLTEIRQLERVLSHSLSFMNSTWCRPKIAIAWRETWSDSQWWGTWSPVWGSWKPTTAAKRNRAKNWLPMDVGPEMVLPQVVRNISDDHFPVVERYVHNAMALENGDWISSITASVAILQRLATHAGFRTERRGLELWEGIAKYLRSKRVERPYYYVGWGEEAKRLIESGERHDRLVKRITELRNQITAHWQQDEIPTNASWLAQQALYYVEAAMRAELAPSAPMWDRTRAFHHPPMPDSPDPSEGEN
jgi:hypothetical protein